ncbi:MAG: hypothetical protein IJ801_08920 [Lachnospiraceae bacterium]|nr:hypothetical protein [Lachnospiraceae bacterium]
MDNEMTLGQWVVTLLLTCIPCVNIIMLFIWAFGNGEYIAKKRWAQAQLIIAGVALVLYFIFILIFGASLAGVLQSMQ